MGNIVHILCISCAYARRIASVAALYLFRIARKSLAENRQGKPLQDLQGSTDLNRSLLYIFFANLQGIGLKWIDAAESIVVTIQNLSDPLGCGAFLDGTWGFVHEHPHETM